MSIFADYQNTNNHNDPQNPSLHGKTKNNKAGRIRMQSDNSPAQESKLNLKTAIKYSILLGTVAAVAAIAFSYKASNEQASFVTNTSPCLEPKDVLNQQLTSGCFVGITQNQMGEMFQNPARSVTLDEQRKLYNVVANAVKTVGLEALNKSTDLSQQKEIAYAACNTRHAARLYARDIGPWVSEKYSQAMDYYRSRNQTGMTCDQVATKYNGDWQKMVIKAGEPNENVNGIVSYLSKIL